MKLYQYDDLKKVNQALGSFKRNGIPVLETKLLTVDGKTVYYVLTDPKYEQKKKKTQPKKKTPSKTKEVKKDRKAKTDKAKEESKKEKKNKGAKKS